ncbi:MAG: aminotransferase class I/II-fold pyridoxal phosphate-dependent enzyme [Lachnospiraceae bacterium]|nr:aminotransferase class I/II-fold pyridoxal phosphate-dependent enzyme [Lachnospiraceae bacterium]
MNYDFETKIDRRLSGSVKYTRAPEGTLAFTIADSDFLTAPAIQRALEERLACRDYGYMIPRAEFTESFIGWFDRTYQFELKKEWLLPVSGVVPALAVAGHVKSGSVIMNIPNYGMLLSAPKRAGKEVIEVPLKCRITEPGTERWEIDFNRLEEAITPDTELFYLCNPHNPVGRVYSLEELQSISSFARRHHLIVVSDEIHCEILYDHRHIPFFTVDEYAMEHTILLTAPGKTFSIPGIGGAFAVIPNKELRERFQAVSYAVGRPNLFGVAALTAAYRDCDDWKRELLEYLRGNRDYLETEIRKRFPKAVQTHVEGTYLAWIDLGAYINREEQEKWLADHAKVMFNGAEFFHGTGHIRWNFATQRENIQKALERMEKAF